jgi:Uma2 family endonuclease
LSLRSPRRNLITGERMGVEEFLRRCEDLPDLKLAELIEGLVYVPPPVSLEHGELDSLIIWRLGYYAQASPGCRAANSRLGARSHTQADRASC